MGMSFVSQREFDLQLKEQSNERVIVKIRGRRRECKTCFIFYPVTLNRKGLLTCPELPVTWLSQ